VEFRKERQEEEMRWRGETVIADAWVALRSPPITHQSRVGDPSGAQARRPVRRLRRAHPSRPALPNTHVYMYAVLVRTERTEKKRER